MCFLIGSGNEVFILSWCLNFRKKQKRGFYDEIEYCNYPIYFMFIFYQDQQTKQNQGIIDSSQSLSNDNNTL